jgi:cytoskeleton protein RodZ
MERVGERLRRRREELGFTIDDIAKATRYRPEIIRAVEEGRAGVFPAEVYRQAFLRAYAERLHLDPADILRDQKSEEERVQEALKGIRVKPRRDFALRRTIVWLAVVVGVAVALILLYDRVIRVRNLRGGGVTGGYPGGTAVEPAAKPPAGSGGGQMADSTRGGTGGEDRPIVDEDETSKAVGSSPAGTPAAAPEQKPDEGAPAVASGERSAGTPEGSAEPVAGRSPVETEYAGAEARAGRKAKALNWLAVSVTGYAARARLFAGDSLLVSGWLRTGFRDTFYSDKPFWADTIITHADAMALVLNGDKIDLPRTPDNVITDFRISR